MMQPVFKNACVVREGLIVSIMLRAEGKDVTCRSLGKLVLVACMGRMGWTAFG